jgi:thioredoxin 1
MSTIRPDRAAEVRPPGQATRSVSSAKWGMKYAMGGLIAAAGIALLVFAGWRTGRERTGAPDEETVSLPCLLDFWMEGCVPCRRTLPVVETVRRQHAGKLRVECVDIGQHPEMGKLFRIDTVPTLIFFDVAGKEVHRHQGALKQEEMSALLNRLNLMASGTKAAKNDRSLESLVALLEIAPERKSGRDISKREGEVANGFLACYFHGNVRSGCSQRLEEAAHGTISEQLKPSLQGRDLAWNVLDIEEPGNAHWAKTFDLTLEDYDLSRGIVVLVEMAGGKPKRWKVIGDLASYRGDSDALVEYVQNNTADFLSSVQKQP